MSWPSNNQISLSMFIIKVSFLLSNEINLELTEPVFGPRFFFSAFSRSSSSMFSLSISVIKVLHRLWSSCTTHTKSGHLNYHAWRFIHTQKNTNKAHTSWNLPWQSWIWGTSRSGTEASCEYTDATRRTRSPCRSPACEAYRWGSGPPPLCSSCLCWCHRRSGADGREPCSDQSAQIDGRHIVRSVY